jgi:hypothetical protein
MIQAPKPEPRIMRYELSDYEWTAIKPMLPNKPRGVRTALGLSAEIRSSHGCFQIRPPTIQPGQHPKLHRASEDGPDIGDEYKRQDSEQRNKSQMLIVAERKMQ